MTPMPLGYRKAEDSKWMFKHEVAAFLHAARYIESDMRAYYLFGLMYVLGLRAGEAILLEWDHLGPLDAHKLPVTVNVPTLKQRGENLEGLSPKERREASERGARKTTISVPVLTHPRLVLAAFDRKRQPPEERRVRARYLFGGASPGEHISKTQAHRLFVLCYEAAKIRRGHTPHAFRHTAATFLGQAGADHATRQRFLRHTAHDVTETYTHVMPQQWARFKIHRRPDGVIVPGALDLPALKPLVRP